LTWIGVGLLGYGVIELLEAVGLWLLRRWAEYLAVVATSAGLPLEIYEMAKGITVTKIVVFLINVAFVLYILLSKRLFGIRGGHEAYAAERASESLLEVEKSAAVLPDSATEPIPAPADPPEDQPTTASLLH
jgi:hypothetical protein